MRILGMIAAMAVILTGAAVAGAAVKHTRHHQGASMAQGMDMPMADHAAAPDLPAAQLARARLATAKYSNDLDAAKAAGYGILTQQIAGMGYHFINPAVKGFDVSKPPILVYEKHGGKWQLGALEWVFPKKPATPPLKGATLRRLPGGLPLQGRHVRPRGEPGHLPDDEPAVGCGVQLLASGARHDARLDLVPEPGRHVRQHESARARVQLSAARCERGARRPARRLAPARACACR